LKVPDPAGWGIASRLLVAATLLGTILLGACSGNKPQSGTKADTKTEGAPQSISVSTTTVVERATRRSLDVVGSLEAQDDVTVSSQSSGNLEQILVDVGTPVRKGQVIGRIDQRELKLKVAQAEATLRQAEARLGITHGERIDPQKQPDVKQTLAAMERARYDWTAAQRLVDRGHISRQQYDIAQKTFEGAEARYQAALENVRNLEAILEEKRAALAISQEQLGDAAVLSPIAGVVKQKLASQGEYLQPGTPIATIVQINPLRLRLEIPEMVAARIIKGLVVTLKVDTFPDREFKGRIARISPSVDEKNRSLIAEAEVPNENALLKPGMFARARIASEVEVATLMVPDKAVVSLAGVDKVFVVEGGQAVERQVKLGGRNGSLIEVIDGIRVGDRVITSNTDQLHNGKSVSGS
jgi:RND family efflux transporter MFP subunit